jgi:hypothetical protein
MIFDLQSLLIAAIVLALLLVAGRFLVALLGAFFIALLVLFGLAIASDILTGGNAVMGLAEKLIPAVGAIVAGFIGLLRGNAQGGK